MVDGATHKGVAVFRLLRKSFLGCFGIDVAACRIINLGNLFFCQDDSSLQYCPKILRA